MRSYGDFRPSFADPRGWTLPAVLRHRAQTHSDRIYLSVPQAGEEYSYRMTLRLSERIAGAFIEAGGQRGDRILIMAANCSGFIFAWFGSNLAGMVHVPINTAYSGSFLEHQVRTTRPRLAVIGAEFAARFVDAAEACSSITTFFVLGDPSEVSASVDVLRRRGWNAHPFNDLLTGNSAHVDVTPQDLASVFFTSGTTGLSKGVMMPSAQVYFHADEIVSLMRLTDEDAYLTCGPLFHGASAFLAAYPTLISGGRLVLYDKFSASSWASWARDSQATVANLVGVMMDFIWKQPARPDDRNNQLRCIFTVPTPTSITEGFRSRFGVKAFVEVFGMTETCLPILSPYAEDRPPGAAGLLVDDYFDIRLVDPETDQEVRLGEVGELIVRSKVPWTSLLGYYGMPDRTVDAFRNLWFHTGDALRRDSEGWFYFVDRLKDSIRRRGENISSYEVEQAVLEHESVLECAAVAVPADAEAGEDEVMLFVVPQTGSRLTVEELWEFCDRRLPRFCVPRYMKVLDSLPKTPSGKVIKAELRDSGNAGNRDERVIPRLGRQANPDR